MTPNKTTEQPIPAAYMDWISSEFESQKGTIIKDNDFFVFQLACEQSYRHLHSLPPSPVGEAGKPFNLSEADIKVILDKCLKPEEIAGEPALQHDRVDELIRWFSRGGNPKWFQSHAYELVYYIATNSVNRFVDLEPVRQKAYYEGINIPANERSLLERHFPEKLIAPSPNPSRAGEPLDCHSEVGMTVGLIDSLMAIAHMLVQRDWDDPNISEALKDVRADDDLKRIMDVGELPSAKEYIEEQRKRINTLSEALAFTNDLLKKQTERAGETEGFKCPSCGRPWDVLKNNACQCGAYLVPKDKAIQAPAPDVKEEEPLETSLTFENSGDTIKFNCPDQDSSISIIVKNKGARHAMVYGLDLHEAEDAGSFLLRHVKNENLSSEPVNEEPEDQWHPQDYSGKNASPEQVKEGINLDKAQKQIDELLESETPESLKEWHANNTVDTPVEQKGFSMDTASGPEITGYMKVKNGSITPISKEEFEAVAPVEQKLPPCGCTSGEDCNGDCIIPKWLALKLLAIRDALVEGDSAEAYHILYSIASPDFDKLSNEVWRGLEDFAGVPFPTPKRAADPTEQPAHVPDPIQRQKCTCTFGPNDVNPDCAWPNCFTSEIEGEIPEDVDENWESRKIDRLCDVISISEDHIRELQEELRQATIIHEKTGNALQATIATLTQQRDEYPISFAEWIKSNEHQYNDVGMYWEFYDSNDAGSYGLKFLCQTTEELYTLYLETNINKQK